MLTLLGSRHTKDCAGASRRDFLKVGALGLTGLGLADVLRGRALASANGQPTTNKSVIWLWLSGGPTQLETFDPKPDNPSTHRSVVGATRTNVPGIVIGGLFPRVAQHADKYGTIEEEMHKLAPSFDRSVAALLEDIQARGLDEQILLVITGEFGRTPWLDPISGGRDHWPQLCTLALAGGGLRQGLLVGQSSTRADVPRTAPINPQDLMATMFHVLGLPQDLTYTHPNGRPTRMIEHARPIGELVG